MDFVMDGLATGRAMRALTLVGGYTREPHQVGTQGEINWSAQQKNCFSTVVVERTVPFRSPRIPRTSDTVIRRRVNHMPAMGSNPTRVETALGSRHRP